MKSRYISEVIREKSAGKFRRIIILTGARQTGKTTLAKLCFPDYSYLSIEDPVTRPEYTQLTAGQWNLLYPKAILDEIQKEPKLFESIKSVYDQFVNPRFILLGSSQFLLLRKVRESLAGRCSIHEIYPLTIPEMMTENWGDSVIPSFFQQFTIDQRINMLPPSFLLQPEHPKTLERFAYYLRFGGYPAIIEESVNDKERREWLANYIRTYLERDIRDLADFRNLEPFVRIQQISSLLTGQLVNYSHLAREAGVAANTAKRFLQYLEISYQAVLLKPWYKNKMKRLNKSPKLHYLDPGIQQAILRKQGQLSGNEYESAVVAEIFKQWSQMGSPGDLYHLRTLDGREVDLLVELKNGYIAIEIKMTNRVTPTDARHLIGLEEILDKPLIHSFVLSNDMSVLTLSDGVTAMPAAMFVS